MLGTGNLPKIYVRPAKPDDYEGVMAIAPNLWGGTDYLPSNYYTYFSNPFAHPFVGQVDGKVVSTSAQILSCFKFSKHIPSP